MNFIQANFRVNSISKIMVGWGSNAPSPLDNLLFKLKIPISYTVN